MLALSMGTVIIHQPLTGFSTCSQITSPQVTNGKQTSCQKIPIQSRTQVGNKSIRVLTWAKQTLIPLLDQAWDDESTRPTNARPLVTNLRISQTPVNQRRMAAKFGLKIQGSAKGKLAIGSMRSWIQGICECSGGIRTCSLLAFATRARWRGEFGGDCRAMEREGCDFLVVASSPCCGWTPTSNPSEARLGLWRLRPTRPVSIFLYY